MLPEVEKFKINIPNILAFCVLAAYSVLFLMDISPYWFSPNWITDDAMQQVYQFHEVFNPGIFKGDIITESMSLYLAPLHYWLAYLITYLTGDPIVMAHWVMCLQVFLTVIFIFMTINYSAGFFPACMGALWFLHSGILIQRLTGGLPRGWISPFVAIYLYLAAKQSHFFILISLLLACVLNSLAAFLLIASYSLFLFVNYLNKETRAAYTRPVIYFVACCPIYLLVTLHAIKRPESIGKMVTYKEALEMPSLSKEGRFKIAPLPPVTFEFNTQVFQIFTVDYNKVLRPIKPFVGIVVISLIVLICAYAAHRKTPPIPRSLYTFIFATLICYFLARIFAYNLYVPNRYLRFPISIFLICFFCISLWRIFPKRIHSYLALLLLASYVFIGTGSGLQKEAGYNYEKGQDGHIFEWIRKYTAQDSVVAGYPNLVDPLPLFAMRKVYISNETAHPFYDKFYEVVKHRLEVTFRAHYARNMKDFLNALNDEKIDYFIFDRKRFAPEALAKASYFAPFDKLIEELTKNNVGEYAYFQLPKDLDEKAPYLKFIDSNTALVDVKLLRGRF